MAKGAKTPWLRSLPTFCRITESRSPRGFSGGEERVIFSPRGLGPDGDREASSRGPAASLFLEATQLKTERTVIDALWVDSTEVEEQEVDIGT